MTLFVWDFHGVLEKDNENAVIDISNKVLEQAGYKERFTFEDNERFYGLKWFEYFQRLLPNLSHERCMDLQADCFKYAEENMEILAKHIKPNDYAREVLDKINQSGNQQIVISNTRPDDLVWFLESIGLIQYFKKEHVIGVNAHQKHGSKSSALKKHIKGMPFDKIVVIGDSESDLKLGREVSAINYFYKHPHREHENTQNADYIIKDLREVLGELKMTNSLKT